MRYLAEFMTSVPMPETPTLAFIIPIALLAASAARNGLEVIGRLADAVVPLTLVGVLIVLILVAKEADMKALLPILEKGWQPVALGSFLTAARFNEPLVLAMMVPSLTEPKAVLRVVTVAAAGVVAVFVSITVLVIGVFGTSQAVTRVFPFFALVRMVNLGDVIERIEVVHMAIWVLGIVLRTAIYFYLAVLGVAQIFGLRTYRPIVLPLAALMVVLSVWSFDSLADLLKFTSPEILVPYLLFFTWLIPLFLLLLAIIRAKKGSEQC
jgi:spore germination protein KB